jgi:uncharacterized damage-inducible protein DinB
MDLQDHFRMLARYNRIANERLYQSCARLDDTEYRRQRAGSFGNIHALLNHILLGDQIWMSRFKGGGHTTPGLTTILFDSFAELRSAREKQDAEIESFFDGLEPDFLGPRAQLHEQPETRVPGANDQCRHPLFQPSDPPPRPDSRDVKPNLRAASIL